MKPSEYIKKGWTRGTNARDSEGHVVSPRAKEASTWCASGSIEAAFDSSDETNMEFRHHVRLLLTKKKGNLSVWNDNLKTSRQVIKLFEQVEQELGLE